MDNSTIFKNFTTNFFNHTNTDMLAMLFKFIKTSTDILISPSIIPKANIKAVLDALDDELPANVERRQFDFRESMKTVLFQKAVRQYHLQGNPWHDALPDAQAHRMLWNALVAGI